jgi:REP element-mobilizing transposase RayT
MNALHCVWSTYRRKNLIPEDLEKKVWSYIKSTGENEKIMVLTCGGMPNHVHALIVIPPTMLLSKALQILKANSSRFIARHGIDFDWQEGYGAFSVSQSQLANVKRYIANQKEHHKRRNFEDEFIALLKAHNVEYDPKYVFG